MRAVVFLGPSLAAEEAAAILDAVYLPPARQGDVYRAVKEQRPQAIGLIDGAFSQVPAVWHREILFALSQGVHVFGAGSMGALRAAELHAFGMRGVGAIFRAYRAGEYSPYPPPFERDDEVAIDHGPRELGYLATSEALVDIRETFALAVRSGELSLREAVALVAVAAAIHFQDRSYPEVFAAAARSGLPEPQLRRLAVWTAANRVSQKASDAREMLGEMARFVSSGAAPFVADFHFERSSAWERSRLDHDQGHNVDLDEIEQGTLDELRLDPTAFAQMSENASLREAALDVGARQAVGDERTGLDRIRGRHGLARRSDIERWMDQAGVDAAAMDRIVAAETAIARLAPPSFRSILDCLRAIGSARTLRARAVAKRQELAHVVEARRAPTPMEELALFAWWSERQPDAQGAGLEEWAAILRLPDKSRFLTLLWRERLYLQYKQRRGPAA